MTNLMNLTVATAANESASTVALDQELRSPSYRQTYHEISDRHVVETDVIEQLRANLAQLEDLHGRLRFAMSEIVYLTKKN